MSNDGTPMREVIAFETALVRFHGGMVRLVQRCALIGQYESEAA
jgi:hypothetical protein